MKRVISVTITFLLFSFSMLLAGCGQKVANEQILAEFGNQFVTVDELEKEISELSEWKRSKYEDEEGREEYLTLMAESRMLLQVAGEKGLAKDPEIVKQVEEYEHQLVVKKLVEAEVDDQIDVTETDLKVYYEAHKDEYVEPEKVVVTEITLKDEEKAKEIMEQIKGGADFTELAKEIDAKGESMGPGQGSEGKTSAFSRDSFSSVEKFTETVFALEIGEISDVIVQPLREETYYMIARLDEHMPERQQEFSEVESNIRRTVEKQKKDERMEEWLTGLKDANKFKLYPERVPKVVKEEEEGEGEEASEEAEEASEEDENEEAAEAAEEEEAEKAADEQEQSGEAAE